MTILWLADRFGMPGQYRRLWIRALAQTNHRPLEFEVVSLHQMIPATLLTKIGSRKAPTWVPEMGERITTTINRLIQQHKPQAVVLAAPEALACLGLAPEHATLHNLRGSVYWRNGIPHLVTLPISAWNTMVTQKDIGAANYGFESAERFTEARQQGPVLAESGQAPQAGVLGIDQSNPHRSPSGAGKAYGRVLPAAGFRGSFPSVGATQPGSDLESARLDVDSRQESQDSAPGAHDSILDGDADGGAGGVPRVYAAGQSRQPESTVNADDGVHRDRESLASGDIDRPGTSPHDGGIDSDYDGDEDARDASDSADDSDMRDVTGAEDSDTDGSGAVNSLDDDEETDRFFYEPVLSPVGRFVITADLLKLKRILLDGKKSKGPAQPLVLNWTE